MTLDPATLRHLLGESVRAGVVTAREDRIIVDRARALAEHGFTSPAEAQAFDAVVVAFGGTIQGKRYWELSLSALRGEPRYCTHAVLP